MKEVELIIEKYKLDCSVNNFIHKSSAQDLLTKDQWSEICRVMDLSEEFMAIFKEKLCWKSVSIHQKLTKNFIDKYIFRIDWVAILEGVNENIVRTNKQKYEKYRTFALQRVFIELRSNKGVRNYGKFNLGNDNLYDYNIGHFNMDQHETIFLFDKPIKAKKYRKIKWPKWFGFPVSDQGNYKESWKEALSLAEPDDVAKTLDIPNFNIDIFEKITGIPPKMLYTKINEPI